MEEVNLDPARASSKQDKLQPDEQKVFRQLVGLINWAVQGSRPNLAFDLVDLSTKLKQATVEDFVRARKCIQRLKSDSFVLKFNDLGEKDQWKLLVFTDRSLANLCGSGSVGAHLCLLSNNKRSVCARSWSASKIKRVVRSTLAAEMLALKEEIEEALYLKTLCLNFMAEVLTTTGHQ